MEIGRCRNKLLYTLWGIIIILLLTYMKLAKIETGLLLNFNTKLLKEDGIKRFVM